MEPTFKVPIRNIFYMLSYVSNMPEFIKQLSNVEDDLITYDFLAKMFNKEVEELLHRGLIKDYLEYTEETSFISGRLLINESIPLIAERRPVVVCEKDEYSANVMFNQILKITLKNLYQNPHVQESTRNKSFMLWEQLSSVEEINLSREIFLRLTYHRHNVYYKRGIHLARLLYELKLLSHRNDNWSLFNVDMSESELNKLFEDFLYHFYRIKKTEYQVKSERMHWKLKGEGNRTLLPTMLTDISLTHRSKSKKIIIDAKFYKKTFQTYFKRDSFHSANMYQIFAYLKNEPKSFENLRGILIYPFNGEYIHEVYKWEDRMTIEIATVNLNNKWNDIDAELMKIIESS